MIAGLIKADVSAIDVDRPLLELGVDDQNVDYIHAYASMKLGRWETNVESIRRCQAERTPSAAKPAASAILGPTQASEIFGYG